MDFAGKWQCGKGMIGRVWKRSRLVRCAVWLLLSCGLSVIVLMASVSLVPFDDTRLRNLAVSTVVTDRDGRFLRAYLSRDDRWRIPANLEKMSPWMTKATLATEDKRFYSHIGIDPIAIACAVVANLRAGRIVSGASTITMQVAGFALDSRDRTLSRKLKQAFLALQLEANWTKSEILQCYLTHASYGGNVCGVEAAARRYFNKTAAELSLGEASLLAGLPQSPERFRPDEHLSAALERRDYVLRRIAEEGFADRADCERARKIKINPGLFDVPLIAPHFCDIITSLYPSDKHPITTLSTDVQLLAERQLDSAIKKHRGEGISNGAIVVLANDTGEVLALAGSADYWNRFDSGQVNGAFGFRSPGSTLKPFIFALAMDRGLLLPDETVFDVPITIAGYSPMNYDRQFRGPLPASKALAWSLNIPAIDVLRRVGVPEFRDLLTRNEIALEVNPHGDQGLALAIGTCSVRLLDMTRAYASLAAGGVIRDCVWRKESRAFNSRHQWLSSESAASVLQILSDESIRAPEEIDSSLAGVKGIAWKTGTSNGFRDAWTFAVTEKFTVGVWIGNMDGKPSRALVGSRVAAPVALSLARSLKSPGLAPWAESASSMELVKVCSESGLPPGQHCIQFTRGRVLKNHKVARKCSVHRDVMIDRASRYALCTRCSSGHVIDDATCAIFPAEVSSWIRANVHPWATQLVPPHNPDCVTALLGDPPVIISPKRGSDIVLLEELPTSFQKISLSARTADPKDKLYWFVNGSLAGTAPAYEAVEILPKAGTFSVRCVDERGRSTESWFSVNLSSRAEKQVRWSRLSDSN